MPTSFNGALQDKHPNEQTKILNNLDAWNEVSSLTARIQFNIRNEAKLNARKFYWMRRIVNLFEAPFPSDKTLFLDIYDSTCRKASYKGSDIGFKPKVLGRAVKLTKFKSDIRRLTKCSEYEADLKIEELMLGNCPPELVMHKISAYPVWSTWNVIDSAKHPMAFTKKKSAYEVCANLGLNHRDESEPHAILRYFTTDHIAYRCPTVADASNYEYFRPATPSQKCGYTLPRNHQEFAIRGGKCKLCARPEVIHEAPFFHELLPVEIFN